MPDFGLGYKETVITPEVWERCSDDLLRSEENWGTVELGYMYPSETCKYGRIELLNYRDFCPYSIDLDEFKDAREMFSLEEWVDIVLGAIDYNPNNAAQPNGIGCDATISRTEIWQPIDLIQPCSQAAQGYK